MRSIRAAWKLCRLRKDGTLGSLFIGRRAELPLDVWLPAEDIPTKNYAHRPGWHCCTSPHGAPHLTKEPKHEDRIWVLVAVSDYEEVVRPESQGGTWLLAQRMKLVDKVSFAERLSAEELGKLENRALMLGVKDDPRHCAGHWRNGIFELLLFDYPEEFYRWEYPDEPWRW